MFVSGTSHNFSVDCLRGSNVFLTHFCAMNCMLFFVIALIVFIFNANCRVIPRFYIVNLTLGFNFQYKGRYVRSNATASFRYTFNVETPTVSFQTFSEFDLRKLASLFSNK